MRRKHNASWPPCSGCAPAHPPVQVVRCTLENAVSVAKTFLLADVVVTDIPEKGSAPAAAPSGGDYGDY